MHNAIANLFLEWKEIQRINNINTVIGQKWIQMFKVKSKKSPEWKAWGMYLKIAHYQIKVFQSIKLYYNTDSDCNFPIEATFHCRVYGFWRAIFRRQSHAQAGGLPTVDYGSSY